LAAVPTLATACIAAAVSTSPTATGRLLATISTNILTPAASDGGRTVGTSR
jgi:hypothetical protein